MGEVDVDAVAALVHGVAVRTVLPAWRRLAAGDVREKSPGEVVTRVDHEAEALLTDGLRQLLPGAVVVGEEAASANPALLSAVGQAPMAWLVDPLDGTQNFVDGSPDYAVMVALVEGGETVASWIDRPSAGLAYRAVRGGGAYVGPHRLRVVPNDTVGTWRGAALTRFLDARQRAAVARFGAGIGELGAGRVCAGIDYPLVAAGEQDFVLFWRTLPWDHAPGALLVTEAGGVVAHLDGTGYRPGTRREGLVAACGPVAHAAVAKVLDV